MLTAAPGQTAAYVAAVDANLSALKFRRTLTYRAVRVALAAGTELDARRARLLIDNYVSLIETPTGGAS